ncbi:hypothetical protein ACEVRU_001754 [Listeria monocytogenes]|nr:hypothetical protein [Listeria monocytogenes]
MENNKIFLIVLIAFMTMLELKIIYEFISLLSVKKQSDTSRKSFVFLVSFCVLFYTTIIRLQPLVTSIIFLIIIYMQLTLFVKNRLRLFNMVSILLVFSISEVLASEILTIGANVINEKLVYIEFRLCALVLSYQIVLTIYFLLYFISKKKTISRSVMVLLIEFISFVVFSLLVNLLNGTANKFFTIIAIFVVFIAFLIVSIDSLLEKYRLEDAKLIKKEMRGQKIENTKKYNNLFETVHYFNKIFLDIRNGIIKGDNEKALQIIEMVTMNMNKQFIKIDKKHTYIEIVLKEYQKKFKSYYYSMIMNICLDDKKVSQIDEKDFVLLIRSVMNSILSDLEVNKLKEESNKTVINLNLIADEKNIT